MKPNLVCKIVVEKANGSRRRVSGYPITPNRIITVAHDVVEAKSVTEGTTEGDARCCRLFFGVNATPLDAPVFLEWCGVEHGIDVTVLRCQLPAELQPAHELLSRPPGTPVGWQAQGYTELGREKRPGGKDAYSGEMPQISDADATVALSCNTRFITPTKWKGGSGSVAFDKTSPLALAVITKYLEGKDPDQLEAVPICYLLNSPQTRDGFRRAIDFESYARREDHCKRVIAFIASRLKDLGLEPLRQLFDLCPSSPINMEGVYRQADVDDLSKQIAKRFVAHSAVIDVVHTLLDFKFDTGAAHTDTINAILDYLLPLNYAPVVIQRLCEPSTGSPLVGFIENEVATHTLAEIIMAGYDQQPACFVISGGDNPVVRGRPALDYYDGPEEGPSLLDPEMATLRAARNILYDLVEQKDILYGRPMQKSHRPVADERSKETLETNIKAYAAQLQGVLIEMRYSLRRTLYCILQAPSSPQREFRRHVLGALRKYAPQLIFVELIPRDQADNLVEFEIDSHIQRRFKPSV